MESANHARQRQSTALIARELKLFGTEIAALQETRFEAQGQNQEEGYTRGTGVALAVLTTIAKRLASLLASNAAALFPSPRVPSAAKEIRRLHWRLHHFLSNSGLT